MNPALATAVPSLLVLDDGLDGMRRWFYGGDAPAGDAGLGEPWQAAVAGPSFKEMAALSAPSAPAATLARALATRRCCSACRQVADRAV